MANRCRAAPKRRGRRVGVHHFVDVTQGGKARARSAVVGSGEGGPGCAVVGRHADVATLAKVNFADVVTASSAIATEVVKDAELVKEKVKRGRKKYGGKVKKTPKA